MVPKGALSLVIKLSMETERRSRGAGKSSYGLKSLGILAASIVPPVIPLASHTEREPDESNLIKFELRSYVGFSQRRGCTEREIAKCVKSRAIGGAE